MGWGVSWQATLWAKVVTATFSLSGISKYGNKQGGNILQVISTHLEVSGEVILGYLIFSRLVALTTTPARTFAGTRVFAPFDKGCRVGTRVLAAFEKVCRASE